MHTPTRKHPIAHTEKTPLRKSSTHTHSHTRCKHTQGISRHAQNWPCFGTGGGSFRLVFAGRQHMIVTHMHANALSCFPKVHHYCGPHVPFAPEGTTRDEVLLVTQRAHSCTLTRVHATEGRTQNPLLACVTHATRPTQPAVRASPTHTPMTGTVGRGNGKVGLFSLHAEQNRCPIGNAAAFPRFVRFVCLARHTKGTRVVGLTEGGRFTGPPSAVVLANANSTQAVYTTTSAGAKSDNHTAHLAANSTASSWVHGHSDRYASRRILEAQCAFKVLMIHEVLQFALRIAFRCVLHRWGSLDIRC